MDASGWIQLALYVVALAAITKPMGLFLVQVLDAQGRTWFDPLLRPLERLTYRIMGVDPQKEHDWKQYTLAMLLFSLVGCLFTYAILRLQQVLPLNPQGLLVCLIPTTIGGLLSAIGIAGMDRVLQRNVLAMSGRAVEAAGDVDVLLLDKTGTITLGNRMATAFLPAPGIRPERLGDAAQLASLADETPKGRSIAVLAKQQFNLRAPEVAESHATFIPFSAQTRMSGVDFPARDGQPIRSIRKGAADAIRIHVDKLGGSFPKEVGQAVDDIARSGGTPLVVAEGPEVLGMVHLKDVVKGGIRERFAHLRKMGIRTVMITGDNPLTAAAIAAEAGVDDFMAQATPEQKLKRIREEQNAGHLVAMTGDGTLSDPVL